MSMTRREILWDCIWALLDYPYQLDDDKKQENLIKYIKELDSMMPEDKEGYALIKIPQDVDSAAHILEKAAKAIGVFDETEPDDDEKLEIQQLVLAILSAAHESE